MKKDPIPAYPMFLKCCEVEISKFHSNWNLYFDNIKIRKYETEINILIVPRHFSVKKYYPKYLIKYIYLWV